MKLGLKKLICILIKIIQIPLNIALSLLYLILILPYAFIYRKSFAPKIKNDPKNKTLSFWLDINPTDPSLENLRRQY